MNDFRLGSYVVQRRFPYNFKRNWYSFLTNQPLSRIGMDKQYPVHTRSRFQGIKLGSAHKWLTGVNIKSHYKTNLVSLLFFLKNPDSYYLLKGKGFSALSHLTEVMLSKYCNTSLYSNLVPHRAFGFTNVKRIFNSSVNSKYKSQVAPWYHHNIIRFAEALTGKKVLLQFYPFMAQQVSKDAIVRYRL